MIDFLNPLKNNIKSTKSVDRINKFSDKNMYCNEFNNLLSRRNSIKFLNYGIKINIKKLNINKKDKRVIFEFEL